MTIVDIEFEKVKDKDLVAIEVLEESMVDAVKKLNGFNVLGEKLIVRRMGEEVG